MSERRRRDGGPLIVAIDGPSGVGKSTVARYLATRLGVPYLDTGAMYRAIALDLLDRGVDPADRARVEELAATVPVSLERGAEGGEIRVCLQGEPVGPRIRAPEISAATSTIAAYGAVRRRMVDLQRQGAELFGGVVEGRDIGTKVFPGTPFKFFLDAEPEVRVERRHRQLREQGREVGLDEVADEMRRRDLRDSSRTESPLTRDDSYRVVDSSRRSVEEVVDEMERTIAMLDGGP